jgi:hypothetical protein
MFYLSKENFNKEEMNLDQLILEVWKHLFC